MVPPLVPASLLSRTLSSHHPLHPWIRIQCHLLCRKLHLVALKTWGKRDILRRKVDQNLAEDGDRKTFVRILEKIFRFWAGI